jgi:hypothetical protein
MDNVQEHNNCTNLPSSQTFSPVGIVCLWTKAMEFFNNRQFPSYHEHRNMVDIMHMKGTVF